MFRAALYRNMAVLAFHLKSVCVDATIKERHWEDTDGLERVVSYFTVQAIRVKGFTQLYSRDRMGTA